ncbi:sodium:solute symporter [Deminuibacter soli]|uniref:Sodium:solute symporter n=1 Tax=Deminuibacter soli TaxID=2291815 RepID=A0A3E1NDJ5_9BACT|nr:sodium:solute symporter [Deminuibacter soli]RFM26063.1 sodium:solute symporter [Deminuibacter soli]
MSPALLFSFVVAYFVLLLCVAWYTGRNANNDSFFIGNRNSNWMLVAFGMIGTTLSGVTFVSVPGGVGKSAFAYFQITLGYVVGYFTIAYVLLPLYYRMQLTSIYNYLNHRLGIVSYKTGASFFILSRVLGATARLYLVVNILQDTILSSFGVPFWATTLIILLMILLYTYEGGVKTIVYTDTLQTTCMLLGLIICTFYILNYLHLGFGESLHLMGQQGMTRVFNLDVDSKHFFVKEFVAGAFISLTMTGMDQEMMQKNISVKTLGDSQKNIVTMTLTLVVVIALFLFLGGLLHLYAAQVNEPATGDKLFPAIALHHMPPVVSVIFIIALISALFPSADGALTALTSSFCIDLIGMQRRTDWNDVQKKKIRQRTHLIFAALFLAFVMLFKWINNTSMVNVILQIAAYTYGPLLGLFSFGILSKREVNDKLVPIVCLVAPLICLAIDLNQAAWFNGFQIGPELLILNGALTYTGLFFISKRKTA